MDIDSDPGYLSNASNEEYSADVDMEEAYPGCFHSELDSGVGSEETMDPMDQGEGMEVQEVQVQEPVGETVEVSVQEPREREEGTVTLPDTDSEMALLDLEFDPSHEWNESEVLAMLDDIHMCDEKTRSLEYIHGHPGSIQRKQTDDRALADRELADALSSIAQVEEDAKFRFLDPYFLEFLKWTKDIEDTVMGEDIELGIRMERIRTRNGCVPEEAQYRLSTDINRCLLSIEHKSKMKKLEEKQKELEDELDRCKAEFRVARLERAVGMAMAKNSTAELDIKKSELIVERHRNVGMETIINTLKYQNLVKQKEVDEFKDQIEEWRKVVDELKGKGVKRKRGEE